MDQLRMRFQVECPKCGKVVRLTDSMRYVPHQTKGVKCEVAGCVFIDAWRHQRPGENVPVPYFYGQ